jgi:hypothetical protein
MRYGVACKMYMNNINVIIPPIQLQLQEAYDRDDSTDAVPPLLGIRCESFEGDLRSLT